MKRPLARLLKVFVTGLLAALPLLATVAIFWWAVNLLVQWLGPQSLLGGALVHVGIGVTGSEVLGYLIGVALVAALIFALGLLVEANLQQGLARLVRAVMRRIPVVGAVYDMLHKIVGLFSQRDADGLNSMRAVWCHFGGADTPDGPPRAAVLALLSTPEPVLVGGRRYLGVIVPTAPVPVGGGLLYLPEEWVSPADVGMEALTSIYVSMGVTSGQYLKLAQQHPPAVDQPPSSSP